MYSFEGQYRRRPVQSLGGSTKKEPKDVLLQRAELERKKRENRRLEQTSAVVIQSFFRGCRTRQQLKDEERQQFDQLVKSVGSKLTDANVLNVLGELWKKLLFFFNHKTDGSRLIWFCQVCIKYHAKVIQWICQNEFVGLYNIENLLWICCSHVESSATSGSSLAMPLRMLEIFTNAASYTKHTTQPQADKFIHQILNFLIRKGYYRCLRTLIHEKIPPPAEPTTLPPTPMASSIMELVRKPFGVFANTGNPELRYTVLLSLCDELFSQPFSDQIQYYILPSLTKTSPPLPFTDLLEALVSLSTDFRGGLRLQGSVWLLYTVLSLGAPLIDQLSAAHMTLYLRVLDLLSPHLEPARSRSGDLDEEQEEEEEEEDAMEVEESASGSRLCEVQQACVTLLDRPAHVRCVLSALRSAPAPSGSAPQAAHAPVVGICSVCHVLMVYRKLPVHRTRLLYSLAFSPWFIQRLWQTCVSVSTDTVTGSKTSLLQLLSGAISLTPDHQKTIVPLLSVFSALFSHSLFSLHDAEFYGDSHGSGGSGMPMPFPVRDLVPMSAQLKDACLGIIELAHPDTKPSLRTEYRAAFSSVGVPSRAYTDEDLYRLRETWAGLFRVLSRLVKQLYSRDSRRPYCPLGHWLSTRFSIQADKPSQIYHIESEAFRRQPFGKRSALNPKRHLDEEGPPMSTTEVRNITVLTELPFVVSFEERVKILQKLLSLDHAQHQRDSRHFGVGPMINIAVRRAYLYEDAFEKLSPENEPNLKLRLQVQLKNFQGLDEAGIDGGGIFREFMSELLKTSFDPNRGFFKYTADKTLYPSPQSRLLVADFTQHYYFLGRILGKVLYENMLVELPFASFFLNKILSRHGGDVDIHHLASLDPEMYRNLLYLKNYEGDVSDLGLDFTVINNDLGEAQVECLKPGGRDIPVTSHNRIEYIHLMADYRLNKQIRVHCHAFRQGLADVINIDWLRMFDHNELQILISGAEVPIDTTDLRRHTNYSGGYNEGHPAIQSFWRIVESFTDAQKRHLLKFVTSCSRPPLLGFKDLYPSFCVQSAGTEPDRLPSASTCMNLLKLPEFKTEELMRDKLLYAIESGAGFELS